MRFQLEIACNNAAFEDDPAAEILHILEDVTDHLAAGNIPVKSLFDSNGNKVGIVRMVDA